MKPKTRKQIEVVKLSGAMRSLTSKGCIKILMRPLYVTC